MPTPVDGNSPWRQKRDVPYPFWKETILAARNPNGTGERADPDLASEAAWQAARPHTALALAMLKAESTFGTHFEANERGNRNPFNLKRPDGSGYVSYLTWVGGVKGWHDRITSPTYKNGVYAETVSISDLIHRFAPREDNNDTETYIDGVAARMSRYPVLEDPVTTPSTPPEPVTDWRQIFDVMFGRGWKVTQDWAARGGPDLYDYGRGHGLDGSQHTGIDVGIPYGTPIRAPFPGIVVCAGTGVGKGVSGQGCGAFGDWGDGDSVRQGVGRIELLFGNGASLIFGHSRTATVEPGEVVAAGQQIGTSGGMYGPHIHLEARTFTGNSYQIVDPKALLLSLAAQSKPPVPGEEETPMASPIDIRRATSWSGANRPKTKLTAGKPLYVIQHDTGNTGRGANATMHKDFVIGGGGSDTVSFHFTVDSTGLVWQMLPLDEIGYHAADGCNNREIDIGCFQGIAIEMCRNSDGDQWKAYGHVKDLIAAIILGDPRINYGTRSHKDFSADRIRSHKWASRNDVNPPNGKWCSSWILNNGLEDDLVAGVKARVAAAGQGQTPAPEPPPTPKPVEILPGLDAGILDRLFGELEGEDGRQYKFDPNGPVSKLWLARGKQLGTWPRLETVWVYADGRRYFRFEDGAVIFDPPGSPPPAWLKAEVA